MIFFFFVAWIQIKLDEYKADQKKGQVLNEDQLSAVAKYDEVSRTLELARELEKQFIGLASDVCSSDTYMNFI